MPGLDSEALNFRDASELFAPVRCLRRADLQTLRFVTTHQGRTVPTVGGMLLVGENREHYFPDAWIKAGRFQGVDKSRILVGSFRAPQISLRERLNLPCGTAAHEVERLLV